MNNDIENNPGIETSDTICFRERGLTKPQPEEITASEELLLFNDFAATNVTHIWFKEYNSQNQLIDSSFAEYDPISLVNSQIISFASASASLNTTLPLEDQIDKVPVRVEIKLFGPDVANTTEEVSNVITWTYDMSCGSNPIQTGDTIGWLNVVSTCFANE